MTFRKLLFLTCLSLLLASFVFGQSADDFDSMNKPVEPFRIAGNIYYVGASDVTSYLIVTPKGDILIDSGLPQTVPLIKQNIEKLGFKLTDVKIILNSHAHFDHAGGIGELRRATGAAFYASAKDAPLLERGGLDDPNYGDRYPFEKTKPDKLLNSGQKVTLGDITLTANITSGHTPGCTTWTTTVNDRSRDMNVMFLCSVSAPGYKLVDNKKYPSIESDYRASFAWLKTQKVDVFLAAHGSIFGLTEKRGRLLTSKGINPFVDAEGYAEFIEKSEKEFLEKLKTQKAPTK